MLRRLVFGLILVALVAPAQRQLTPAEVSPDVQMLENVVYSKPGGRDLQLDLFLPKTGAGPFPGIVYIHGGGWRGGSKTQFHRQAAHMARIGFVGATIAYRLSGEAKYPAAVEELEGGGEVDEGERGEVSHRPETDRRRAGGSAGGHLVSLLGARREVEAVAAFNPVTDFVVAGKGLPAGATTAVSSFVGFTCAEKPEIWAEASPMTHAGKASAPFLFLHGTADKTVPYEQSTEMAKKLKTAGVRAEVFTAEGAAHGFFNGPPWYEPSLKRMEEFFRTVLQ